MTTGPSPSPEETARRVQELLDHYRRGLYGGRGPGIGEREWLANTSLRAAVAGVPVAASREELHARTLRARGEADAARQESAWAAAQFRAGPPPGARRDRSRPRPAAVVLVLLAAWLRARRQQ